MRLSINENTVDPHYSEDFISTNPPDKITCNPEIDTHSTCNLWTRMHAYSNETWITLHTTSSRWTFWTQLLCFLISSYTVNKYLFCYLFMTKFSTFLYVLLVILLFKMAPKHSAEVLFSVPKCKKLWWAL